MAVTLSGDAATFRTNLGLGSAATLDVGTSANQIAQLDGTGKLPAVDGSALTGIQTTTFSADDAILRFSAAEGGADASGVTQFTSAQGTFQSAVAQPTGLNKYYVNGDCTITGDWDAADSGSCRTLLVVNGTFTINSGVTLTWNKAGAPRGNHGNFGARRGYQNGGAGGMGGGGVGGDAPPAGDSHVNIIRQPAGANANADGSEVWGKSSTLAYTHGLINPMNVEDFMAYGAGGQEETDCSSNADTNQGGGCFVVIAKKIVNNGTINADGNSSTFAIANCSDGSGGGGGGMIALYAFDKESVFGTLTAKGGGWTNGSNSGNGSGPGGNGLIIGGIY